MTLGVRVALTPKCMAQGEHILELSGRIAREALSRGGAVLAINDEDLTEWDFSFVPEYREPGEREPMPEHFRITATAPQWGDLTESQKFQHDFPQAGVSE